MKIAVLASKNSKLHGVYSPENIEAMLGIVSDSFGISIDKCETICEKRYDTLVYFVFNRGRKIAEFALFE